MSEGESGMSPTEKVRAMLDERGIEWSKPSDAYWILLGGMPTSDYVTIVDDAVIDETTDGMLVVENVTPAQAVAAITTPKEADDSQTLRSCPFCGSSASMDVRLIEPSWWIACVMCDGINDHICSCQIAVSGDTEQKAIECAIAAWNRRV